MVAIRVYQNWILPSILIALSIRCTHCCVITAVWRGAFAKWISKEALKLYDYAYNIFDLRTILDRLYLGYLLSVRRRSSVSARCRGGLQLRGSVSRDVDQGLSGLLKLQKMLDSIRSLIVRPIIDLRCSGLVFLRLMILPLYPHTICRTLQSHAQALSVTIYNFN